MERLECIGPLNNNNFNKNVCNKLKIQSNTDQKFINDKKEKTINRKARNTRHILTNARGKTRKRFSQICTKCFQNN